MRTHDNLYLKESRYNNPKESHKYLIKILKKENLKNKIYKVLDIGCSNGELINILEKNFKNFRITGIDIKESLLKKAKKNVSKSISFKKLNFNSNIKFFGKFDIIICSGVISIFDNLNMFAKNIKRCSNNKSMIYLFESFNEWDYDVLTKYKDLNYKKKIYQTGWNIWSIKTISNIFKNKRIKKFRFYINKDIKKNKNDLVRSWTIKIDKKRFFTNALLSLQNQMWLKIF